MGQAPLSCLAEEIDTPGDGQIRALITIAGNPVLSAPDAGRLDAALPQLDAMISIDNYLNETSRHAHVILPGLSPLEQPHCDEELWAFALRGVARWSPAIFDAGDRPEEWEIAAAARGHPRRDARGRGRRRPARRPLVRRPCGPPRHRPGRPSTTTGRRGPDRIVDLTLRTSPWGDGYGEPARRPHARTAQGAPPRHRLRPVRPPRSTTCCAPNRATSSWPTTSSSDDLPRLRRRMTEPRAPLVLIGRRHVRSNNSWMHNLPGADAGP